MRGGTCTRWPQVGFVGHAMTPCVIAICAWLKRVRRVHPNWFDVVPTFHERAESFLQCQ